MSSNGDHISRELLAVAAQSLNTSSLKLSLESGVGDVAGWDSFAQVGLLLKVEEHFKIAFDTEDLLVMETLGDILAAVKRLAA